MHDYKLTYFNLRWLGEGARLLFLYAGVPFEDVRISGEEWPELKPKTTFGQLPLLEFDGQVIAQSAAIYRFLGRRFNLVPECPIEEAIADSLYDAHKDFHAEIKSFIPVAGGFVPGDKDKLIKDVLLPARDKYFVQLENFLKKTKGDHLIGKSLTWVDIVIADNLDMIHILAPAVFDGHPLVKKFVDHIHELPQLKDYFKQRPATPL